MSESPTPGQETESREETSHDGVWLVILFNDDHHSMDMVVETLIAATGFEFQRCFEIMMTAHHRGQAEVTRTHRPRAQRIVAILRDSGLGAEMRRIGQ
jgi:ATP-dependent Clp protease adapter protein ClpS